MATHLRIDNPLFSHTLFGLYLGLMAWGGLYHARRGAARANSAAAAPIDIHSSLISNYGGIHVRDYCCHRRHSRARHRGGSDPGRDQADTFSVRREIDIKSPPENIFPLINDFHQWKSWSP